MRLIDLLAVVTAVAAVVAAVPLQENRPLSSTDSQTITGEDDVKTVQEILDNAKPEDNDIGSPATETSPAIEEEIVVVPLELSDGTETVVVAANNVTYTVTHQDGETSKVMDDMPVKVESNKAVETSTTGAIEGIVTPEENADESPLVEYIDPDYMQEPIVPEAVYRENQFTFDFPEEQVNPEYNKDYSSPDYTVEKSSPDYPNMEQVNPEYTKEQPSPDFTVDQSSPDYTGEQSNSDNTKEEPSPDYAVEQPSHAERVSPDYPMEQSSPDYPMEQSSPNYPVEKSSPDYAVNKPSPDYHEERVSPDYPMLEQDYPEELVNRDYDYSFAMNERPDTFMPGNEAQFYDTMTPEIIEPEPSPYRNAMYSNQQDNTPIDSDPSEDSVNYTEGETMPIHIKPFSRSEHMKPEIMEPIERDSFLMPQDMIPEVNIATEETTNDGGGEVVADPQSSVKDVAIVIGAIENPHPQPMVGDNTAADPTNEPVVNSLPLNVNRYFNVMSAIFGLPRFTRMSQSSEMTMEKQPNEPENMPIENQVYNEEPDTTATDSQMADDLNIDIRIRDEMINVNGMVFPLMKPSGVMKYIGGLLDEAQSMAYDNNMRQAYENNMRQAYDNNMRQAYDNNMRQAYDNNMRQAYDNNMHEAYDNNMRQAYDNNMRQAYENNMRQAYENNMREVYYKLMGSYHPASQNSLMRDSYYLRRDMSPKMYPLLSVMDAAVQNDNRMRSMSAAYQQPDHYHPYY